MSTSHCWLGSSLNKIISPFNLCECPAVRDVGYYCDLFPKHFRQIPENTELWGPQANWPLVTPYSHLLEPSLGSPKQLPYTAFVDSPDLPTTQDGSPHSRQHAHPPAPRLTAAGVRNGPLTPQVTPLISWRGFHSTFLTPAFYIHPFTNLRPCSSKLLHPPDVRMGQCLVLSLPYYFSGSGPQTTYLSHQLKGPMKNEASLNAMWNPVLDPAIDKER